MNSVLDSICIVLYEPQNDINIGTTVRAAKNFGITDIRLVRPRVADPDTILISAPRSIETIASIHQYEDLESALAGCVYVVGATARMRKGSWTVGEPRSAAQEICNRASVGTVAMLFGREDSGLPNAALDRCQHVVTVPTRPDYSSLNLGQAVLLMAWEVFRVANQIGESSAEPEHEPMTVEKIERMLEFAELALDQIGFFKSGGKEHVMRAVRSVFMRADLDARELAIWFGIFKEIPAFIIRDRADRSTE